MECPIITLTTDFGIKDAYSAILKGCLLQVNPKYNLIDISHEVEQFDVVAAAFLLKQAYSLFPKRTVNLVGVNLYYAQENELLFFEYDGQYFIGPNNGVFCLMFPTLRDTDVYVLKYSDLVDFSAYRQMATFLSCIGSDRAIYEVAQKGVRLLKGFSLQPVIGKDALRATVIHVDHYGNVITNITPEIFEKVRKGRTFKIYYNPLMPIQQLSKSYGDVAVGEVVCLFNSAGYLEVAINLGKASTLLGLHKDETIHIDFENI